MKLRFREKFAYGCGEFGLDVIFCMVSSYLTLYATDVLNLNVALVGAFLLVPKIFDVTTNLLFVPVMEKMNTRIGKYRPWLLLSILYCITFVLLFWKPAFLTTQTRCLWWIFILFTLNSPLFGTMLNCPYMAMDTLIISDREDQMGLISYRTTMTEVAQLIISCSFMPLLLFFGKDHRDANGWFVTAILYGVVSLISVLICFFGVRERVRHKERNQENALFFREKLKILWDNTMFRKLSGLQFCLFVVWQFGACMVPYFVIYRLMNEKYILVISVFALVVSTLASFVWPFFSKRLPKSKIMEIGSLLIALSGLLIIFAKNIYTLCIFLFVNSVGIVAMNLYIYSFVPEVNDYILQKKGIALTGMVQGLLTAFFKLGAAIGVFAVSLLLAFGRYDSTQTVQNPLVLGVMSWGIVGVCVCMGLLMFFVTRSMAGHGEDKNFVPQKKKKAE